MEIFRSETKTNPVLKLDLAVYAIFGNQKKRFPEQRAESARSSKHVSGDRFTVVRTKVGRSHMLSSLNLSLYLSLFSFQDSSSIIVQIRSWSLGSQASSNTHMSEIEIEKKGGGNI